MTQNTKNIKFARNLVKGKIAETIFAQMYREMQHFTVLEFGYEKIIPELVQSGYDPHNGMIETLRSAPDFAVIDSHKRQVRLIEVKYKYALDTDRILGDAERMSKSWNPSFLFVATLDGFYFDEIDKIVERNGQIAPLSDNEIPLEIQEQYIQILRDFEQR